MRSGLLSVLILLCSPKAAFAKSVKSLSLSDDMVATVPVSYRGTIISFPTKPIKVIIGNQGAFVVEYVNNDVVISPLTSHSRSNVFVYLEGRRFTLDAVARASGYAIVRIKDKVTVGSSEVQYERK